MFSNESTSFKTIPISGNPFLDLDNNSLSRAAFNKEQNLAR